MDYPEELVREAARTIRPFLADMVGGPEAAILDARMAELLAQAQTGQSIGGRVGEILAQRDRTRNWLQLFLQTGVGPGATRGYQPFPGPAPTPQPGTKFQCPDGDYVWYRPFIGVPAPMCPTHKLQLVKAP